MTLSNLYAPSKHHISTSITTHSKSVQPASRPTEKVHRRKFFCHLRNAQVFDTNTAGKKVNKIGVHVLLQFSIFPYRKTGSKMTWCVEWKNLFSIVSLYPFHLSGLCAWDLRRRYIGKDRNDFYGFAELDIYIQQRSKLKPTQRF